MKKKNVLFLLALCVIGLWIVFIKMHDTYLESKETKRIYFQKHYDYYKVMKKNGFYTEEIALIKHHCKKSNDFHKCLAMTTAIKVAEQGTELVKKSGVGYSHNNLFSIKGQYGFIEYDSRKDSINDFMWKYLKYRHKNNCTEMMTKSNYLKYNETRKYNCLYTIRQFDYI